MKFEIDIPVQAGDDAMGRICGVIELIATPAVGARVDLQGSGRNYPRASGFRPQLGIEDVIFFPVIDGMPRPTLLMLNGLALQTSEEATLVIDYLQQEYQLDFEAY